MRLCAFGSRGRGLVIIIAFTVAAARGGGSSGTGTGTGTGTGSTGLPTPPKRAPQFEWVDEVHRISVAKAFVSRAERDYILRLVEQEDRAAADGAGGGAGGHHHRGGGGWAPTPTGGPGFLGPASTAGFQAAVRRDPVIRRLEARIANATGM
jgi:hypothetical protein